MDNKRELFLMIYSLDTNICIYIANGKHPHLNKRFATCVDEIIIPSIVLYELYYGAEKSQHPVQNIDRVWKFISGIRVVPFELRSAEIAGKIRADLELKGLIIGGNDILIAATTIANNATLVTNNEREFERVEGLLLENWVHSNQS